MSNILLISKIYTLALMFPSVQILEGLEHEGLRCRRGADGFGVAVVAEDEATLLGAPVFGHHKRVDGGACLLVHGVDMGDAPIDDAVGEFVDAGLVLDQGDEVSVPT